jgi:hypothetical protein
MRSSQQLPLLDAPRRGPPRRPSRRDEAWRLDERTREVGRRGVESARDALREAARRMATRAAA